MADCNCFKIDNAAPRGTALSRAWIGKPCCTSAAALYTWLVGRAPFFRRSGCGGVKNVKGTTTLSVHSEGRAFDVSLADPNHPWQRQFMWDRLNQMVEHGCILGLQRIIFNGRIWDMNMGYGVTGPTGWRRFTGSQNHNDHAHVEVCRMSCSRVNSDIVNYVLGIRTPQPLPSVGTPGSSAGSNTGGGLTGTPPPAVAPTPPEPPAVTATAPVWIDTSVCGQCGLTGFTAEEIVLEEKVAVRLVCGGSGGYCVDKRSGAWCGSGLVREWGQTGGNFGGAVVDVQTYGNDLYALVNVGNTQTIRSVSRNILTVHPLPECGVFQGPWTRLTVANNGTILLSNSEDAGGSYHMCGFEVPRLVGSTCCGGQTTPPRTPVEPVYEVCDEPWTDDFERASPLGSAWQTQSQPPITLPFGYTDPVIVDGRWAHPATGSGGAASTLLKAAAFRSAPSNCGTQFIETEVLGTVQGGGGPINGGTSTDPHVTGPNFRNFIELMLIADPAAGTFMKVLFATSVSSGVLSTPTVSSSLSVRFVNAGETIDQSYTFPIQNYGVIIHHARPFQARVNRASGNYYVALGSVVLTGTIPTGFPWGTYQGASIRWDNGTASSAGNFVSPSFDYVSGGASSLVF